MIDLLTLKPS